MPFWGVMACNSFALERLHFQFDWVYTPQFAGFFVAKELGFYKKEGIDVVFHPFVLRSGKDLWDTYSLKESFDGEAFLGIVSWEVFWRFFNKDNDLLRVISIIYQKSPFVFIVKKDSVIGEPYDFKGKKMVIKVKNYLKNNRFSPILTVLKNVGLTVKDIIPFYPKNPLDLTPFIKGDVDIWTGWAMDEPIRLEQRGVGVRLIYASDYGYAIKEGLIVVRKDILNEHKDLIKRFLKATLKGWYYVLMHPNRSAYIIKTYTNETLFYRKESIYRLCNLIVHEKGIGYIDIPQQIGLMIKTPFLGMFNDKDLLKNSFLSCFDLSIWKQVIGSVLRELKLKR